jgi:hypothetical protein
VLEIIDPVFAKTSQNVRFLLSENDRFGLVFVKTGSINSGTALDADPVIFVGFFQETNKNLSLFLPIFSAYYLLWVPLQQ